MFTGLENVAVDTRSLAGNLQELKAKINSKEKTLPGNRQAAIRTYRLRSAMVKAYALLRAGGTCELCEKLAPFKTAGGIPFLEVHHILKLADDGRDETGNVAALCPNCHRKAHYGANITAIKKYFTCGYGPQRYTLIKITSRLKLSGSFTAC